MSPSIAEAARIDAEIESIKNQIESGLQAILIKDTEYQSMLWMMFVQANLGVLPMLEVLGDSRDPMFAEVRDFDAPARFGMFQCIRDLSVKYGQRQEESVWRRLFCVTSPMACLALAGAKRLLGLSGFDPAEEALLARRVHPSGAVGLGAEPLTILIVAGAAAIALVGIALVASIAYSITKSKEIASFNDMYKARCTSANKSKADEAWCNKLGAPAAQNPIVALGQTFAVVGAMFIFGLFVYRRVSEKSGPATIRVSGVSVSPPRRPATKQLRTVKGLLRA